MYHLGNPNTWSGSVTLIEESDGYIICGKTGTDIGMIKIDPTGEQLWSKTWGDTIASWYTGYPGSLISQETGYYLAGTKNYLSPSRQVGLLMHFNSIWDTLWTKEFNMNMDDNPDTATRINQITICNNSDLVLVGDVYKSETGSNILLIRTDSSGSIIWYKTYSYLKTMFTDGYSVIQTADHGFAIGGFWWISGSPTATGDPIIIKTDSSGNQTWIRNIGESFEDNSACLSNSKDDNIIVGTNIADFEGGGTPYSRINIVKMDNDGEILWNKKYGATEFINYLSNIRCQDDGSILCTGSVWSDIPGGLGWILKVDSNGDSLWYRNYQLLNGGSSLNRLKDIIPVNDNSYLTCGTIYPASPDTGIQSAWVIKLDSIGCEFEGCDSTVGVDEQGSMEAWGQGRREAGKCGSMEIWPNPAHDQIILTFPEYISLETEEIKIYNLFGQEVMKTKVSPQNKMFSLNISSLRSGLYLVRCKDSKNKILTGKFVVAR
jgi:hypothetical protein